MRKALFVRLASGLVDYGRRRDLSVEFEDVAEASGGLLAQTVELASLGRDRFRVYEVLLLDDCADVRLVKKTWTDKQTLSRICVDLPIDPAISGSVSAPQPFSEVCGQS